VVTLASESRDGISKSCCTGSDCETCDTAFESSDALFKNVLRGIGEAAVNVACILQMETVRSVLSAVEHVRGGLVYRNCAGIGCRVCLFLTNVELKSFEMELILSRHII
jgi:sporulation-control protein spo0M